MKGEKLIKVCGMRESANIRAVDSLGIDLMGFIFYAPSPRNVVELPSVMPCHARRVGVFVDAPFEEIRERVSQFSLDYVQLHGKESAEMCRSVRNLGVKVIKAFRVASASDLVQTGQYAGECDLFLFDTKTELAGGSGRCFDWSVLDEYKGDTPFLLSGGIGPESAEGLTSFSHPMLAGYDLNSRFETEPALKDVGLLKQFLNAI